MKKLFLLALSVFFVLPLVACVTDYGDNETDYGDYEPDCILGTLKNTKIHMHMYM